MWQSDTGEDNNPILIGACVVLDASSSVSTIAQAKGQASIKAGFFFWQTARLVGVIRQGLRDTRTVGLGLRCAEGGEVRTLDRTSDGCCGSGVGKQLKASRD